MDPFESSDPPRARFASLDFAATTIGEAWLAIGTQILASGRNGTYDGLAIRELVLATLTIDQPSSVDDFIDRHADQERLAWMHTNFTDHRRVPELGDADSYATRLRDYESSGKNQLRWVVERLRADPTSRSATITTLQPLSDTSYVPCISLLDFFILADGLQLVVYAHSIDFGTKGYANLVELAHLQEEVAQQLGTEVATLTLIVKSAHVYSGDETFLQNVVRARESD